MPVMSTPPTTRFDAVMFAAQHSHVSIVKKRSTSRSCQHASPQTLTSWAFAWFASPITAVA